jgi:hypothetical protein
MRFLSVVVAAFAAAMLAVSAPVAAQASSVTSHAPSAIYKFRILRIINTARTPRVPVAHQVRNCVNVQFLFGGLPTRGWYEALVGANGILWKSPVRHTPGTVCSPPRSHRGLVYTQIWVTRGTIAENVTVWMFTS